jgi:hypothetical protein
MFTKIELAERLADARNNELIGTADFLNELKNDFIECWMAKSDSQFVEDYINQSGIRISKIAFNQFTLIY